MVSLNLYTSVDYFENLIDLIFLRKVVSKINQIKSTHYGEVQYYFLADFAGETRGLALISVYDPPNSELLDQSSGALWLERYRGDETLKVINIKLILTCVGMIPFVEPPDDRFFVCEKMGLEIGSFCGDTEDWGTRCVELSK